MDNDDDIEGDTSLLSIRLLRLFDLLYSTNSVTRAGEAMGQSQPTVSNWLARLRRQPRKRGAFHKRATTRLRPLASSG